MSAGLRSVFRSGLRPGAGGTLPVAVALVLVVVLAAGIEGTSEFRGARWLPNLGGHISHRIRTATSIVPVQLPPVRRVHHHATSLPWWVGAIVVTLLVLALAFGVWRWWGAHRRPAAPLSRRSTAAATQAKPVPEPEPEPETLLSGIALALAVLDEQREPGDAVVRAWLGLEQTAEESGIARRPAETPTESRTRPPTSCTCRSKATARCSSSSSRRPRTPRRSPPSTPSAARP